MTFIAVFKSLVGNKPLFSVYSLGLLSSLWLILAKPGEKFRPSDAFNKVALDEVTIRRSVVVDEVS